MANKMVRGSHQPLRYYTTALAICLTFAASGSSAHAQTPPTQFLNILAGSTGGVFYLLGRALSTVLSDALPGVRVSAQVTKGSTDNLQLLARSRGEIAFVQGDVLGSAWNGDVEGGFPTRNDKLRVVSALHLNYIHVFTLADTGIRSLADLKGKRVSVGPASSGTELNARAVLSASGLRYQDLLKVEYLRYEAAVDLMKNRRVDAAFQTSGLGLPAIQDLAGSFTVSFIPIAKGIIDKLGPPFTGTIIPSGSYPGLDVDVPAIGVANYLVTRTDLSDDLVYQITKAMFSSLPVLESAHIAGASIKPERALEGLPVPLHSGAERYFRETGTLK